MKIFIFFLSIELILLTYVSSRSNVQRLVINNHEWIVPDEPGWEDILIEANGLREKYFHNCQSNKECRGVINLLRGVFLKHPVSAKYLMDERTMADKIFKWG